MPLIPEIRRKRSSHPIWQLQTTNKLIRKSLFLGAIVQIDVIGKYITLRSMRSKQTVFRHNFYSAMMKQFKKFSEINSVAHQVTEYTDGSGSSRGRLLYKSFDHNSSETQR